MFCRFYLENVLIFLFVDLFVDVGGKSPVLNIMKIFRGCGGEAPCTVDPGRGWKGNGHL
jgi:hypothetical protein